MRSAEPVRSPSVSRLAVVRCARLGDRRLQQRYAIASNNNSFSNPFASSLARSRTRARCRAIPAAGAQSCRSRPLGAAATCAAPVPTAAVSAANKISAAVSTAGAAIPAAAAHQHRNIHRRLAACRTSGCDRLGVPSGAASCCGAAAGIGKAGTGMAVRRSPSRKGETVQTLSRRYGVPPFAIAEANGMTTGTPIYPGQRLVIPKYASGWLADRCRSAAFGRQPQLAAAPVRRQRPCAGARRAGRVPCTPLRRARRCSASRAATR